MTKKAKTEPAVDRALEQIVIRFPTALVPHSWRVSDWDRLAPDVFPHTASAARHLIRCNKTALVKAKALARVGRDTIVLGPAYDRWLTAQGDKVLEYVIQPNRAKTP